MHNLTESIFIIVFIILLQLLIYHFFLKSIISTWGASREETFMAMLGDDKALKITSTRAILINAPLSAVWECLMQLGADRAGFYSYTFIERALGYKTRALGLIETKFKEFKVGDLVRGSIDEKSSLFPYNFLVLSVNSEESLVLNNWGTFLLKKVSAQQTRLIIRTQVPKDSRLLKKLGEYVILPLHFIMERRTLMGLKECAEMGGAVRLAHPKDVLWFFGVVLSILLIWVIVFLGHGLIQSIVFPVFLSFFWLLSLLLFSPTPLYSFGLLFVVCGFIFLR